MGGRGDAVVFCFKIGGGRVLSLDLGTSLPDPLVLPMLDSLYGNLLGSTKPAAFTGPVGPVGPGALPGPQREGPMGPPIGPVMGPAGPPVGKVVAGDDIFAPQVQGAPKESKDEPRHAPLPQSFAAAKLMMPPARKKVESTGKRSMLPPLDIQKLQEEKEALLRQRAAAADKESEKLPAGDASDVSAVSPTGTGTSPLSLFGSPDEEYDPAKPNDYDEFCRRRMRLKAEEEMERRRALARQKVKEAEPPKEDDFATRMLKKMGWQGGGLGKEGQGIAAPLVMQKTATAQGAIVQGTKREAAAPEPQPEKRAKKEVNRPSRILLLTNMVGAGEVDADLEEETGEEAGKYGKLRKCVIKEIPGVTDDLAVRIYLEYERIEDATKALVDMNGRYFGGRVVKARFFDEEQYAKGDLESKDD